MEDHKADTKDPETAHTFLEVNPSLGRADIQNIVPKEDGGGGELAWDSRPSQRKAIIQEMKETAKEFVDDPDVPPLE